MKKKTPEQELKQLTNELRRDILHHAHIKEYGCQDPFWTDGVNMNLVRNHIIYDKRQILELCSANGMELPDEYFKPTPAEVDKNYMANLNQQKRVKTLRQLGNKLVTGKLAEYDNQMRFI